MSSRQTVVALLGSVTPPGRLYRSVDEALVRLVERADVRVELIDLAQNEIPFADGRSAEELGGDVLRIVEAVSAAGAVLVVTPVYRGTLTGALKNLLDHLTVPSLEGKPTAIVAMGVTLHHFLGAERHLRDILAFFGAVVAPVSAYLSASDFDADGATGIRAARELDELLDGLVVLGSALATAAGPLGPRPLAARERPQT
jgi:FMN reductase